MKGSNWFGLSKGMRRQYLDDFPSIGHGGVRGQPWAVVVGYGQYNQVVLELEGLHLCTRDLSLYTVRAVDTVEVQKGQPFHHAML